jgi:hypothetical protein
VLGCIDVLGRGEITDRKHAFKRELLGRAGIPYWIIESQRRPSAALLREKFLGAANSEAVKPATAERAPRPAPAKLEQPQLSRVSSNASDLTKTGMTPLHLKSTLKLQALARAFACAWPAKSRRATAWATQHQAPAVRLCRGLRPLGDKGETGGPLLPLLLLPLSLWERVGVRASGD